MTKRPRHPYQCGPATATVIPRLRGWYVEEMWFELDRQENQQPCWECYGPYDTQEAAQAVAEVLTR